jgi:molecular chaperone GrpE
VSDETTQTPAPAAVEEANGEAAGRDAARDEQAEALARAEDGQRRALADLDNLRKRTAREIESRLERSRESLLREWLDALDSVERALAITPEGPVREGLRLVLEQMEAILARHGARRVGRPGDPFDPRLHDAVAVREDENVSGPTVVEVVRAGFTIGERVLRPAQVVVARPPESEA